MLFHWLVTGIVDSINFRGLIHPPVPPLDIGNELANPFGKADHPLDLHEKEFFFFICVFLCVCVFVCVGVCVVCLVSCHSMNSSRMANSAMRSSSLTRLSISSAQSSIHSPVTSLENRVEDVSHSS